MKMHKIFHYLLGILGVVGIILLVTKVSILVDSAESPILLQETSVEETTIDLEWVVDNRQIDEQLIDSFTIEYEEFRSNNPQQINVGLDLSYQLNALTSNTQYSITIIAEGMFDGKIISQVSSNTIEVTTLVSSSLPTITLQSATVNSSNIIVTWTTNPAYSTYNISVSSSKGNSTITGLNRSPYSFTTAEVGIPYTFYVTGQGLNGSSDPSNSLSATVPTVPGSPTALQATGAENSVLLSWSAPASNGGAPITSYSVGYSSNGGSNWTTVSTGSTSTSYTVSGLTNNTLYTFRVAATNSRGSGLNSSTTTATPVSNIALTISNVQTSTTNTTATITWMTTKEAKSVLEYGLIDGGRETPELDPIDSYQMFSTTLSGLLSCTEYDFFITAYVNDEIDQTEKSVFLTSGCEGDATIGTVVKERVTLLTGAKLNFNNQGVKAEITVPVNAVETNASEIIIQAKKLDKEEAVLETKLPREKTWLGDHIYKLTAYIDETEKVDSFEEPVVVTIDYTAEDIRDYDPSTLNIYHYKNGVWEKLSGCSNSFNGITGTISCDTDSFSIFGLFGEPPETLSSGSLPNPQPIIDTGSNQGSTTSSNGSTTSSTNKNSVEIIPTQTDTTDSPATISEISTLLKNPFTKNLWLGVKDAEVKLLQQFLNQIGFSIAITGPGSVGQETEYFGPNTLRALKDFQAKYAEQILNPLGLSIPTGYFGSMTRVFINTNFSQ